MANNRNGWEKGTCHLVGASDRQVVILAMVMTWVTEASVVISMVGTVFIIEKWVRHLLIKKFRSSQWSRLEYNWLVLGCQMNLWWYQWLREHSSWKNGWGICWKKIWKNHLDDFSEFFFIFTRESSQRSRLEYNWLVLGCQKHLWWY